MFMDDVQDWTIDMMEEFNDSEPKIWASYVPGEYDSEIVLLFYMKGKMAHIASDWAYSWEEKAKAQNMPEHLFDILEYLVGSTIQNVDDTIAENPDWDPEYTQAYWDDLADNFYDALSDDYYELLQIKQLKFLRDNVRTYVPFWKENFLLNKIKRFRIPEKDLLLDIYHQVAEKTKREVKEQAIGSHGYDHPMFDSWACVDFSIVSDAMQYLELDRSDFPDILNNLLVHEKEMAMEDWEGEIPDDDYFYNLISDSAIVDEVIEQLYVWTKKLNIPTT